MILMGCYRSKFDKPSRRRFKFKMWEICTNDGLSVENIKDVEYINCIHVTTKRKIKISNSFHIYKLRYISAVVSLAEYINFYDELKLVSLASLFLI